MASKGNGVDLTNDLLKQLLGLQQVQLTKLDGLTAEMASVKAEVAGVKREVASVKEEVASLTARVIRIEESIRQVAGFVGELRAEQFRRLDNLESRVEKLERKAA